MSPNYMLRNGILGSSEHVQYGRENFGPHELCHLVCYTHGYVTYMQVEVRRRY